MTAEVGYELSARDPDPSGQLHKRNAYASGRLDIRAVPLIEENERGGV